MMMKRREKVNPGAGSLPALLEKHQGGHKGQRPHPTDESLPTVLYAFCNVHTAEGFGI